MKRLTTNTLGTILSLYVLFAGKVVTCLRGVQIKPNLCYLKMDPLKAIPCNRVHTTIMPSRHTKQLPQHRHCHPASLFVCQRQIQPPHRSHFVPLKLPQPSSQERDFVMPITKPVDAQQAAQMNLTTVTELAAGNPTLGTHAQRSCNDEPLLMEHFVPLQTNIQTPVNTDLFAAELVGYPFPELAEYLISGLREGFHLGYTGPRFAITPKNLRSARDNAAQVTEAIIKELSRGHIAGPFPTPPLENLHCSPLEAVPKNDNTWRIVHVPNFGGVAGSEDFSCATLPTTPLDFQSKI